MSAVKKAIGGHIAVPTQPDMAPFRVMQRTDGILIVYSELAPFGSRTVWEGKKGDKLQDAIKAASDLYVAWKEKMKGGVVR